MSVQSLPYVSPVAEPAPARRRAAEPDSGRDDKAFTLPDEPKQDAAPAAEPSKPRAKVEPAAAAAEAEPSAKPATAPAAATAPAVAKPAEATQAEPAPAIAQPAKLDIGALISIAVAVAGESAAPAKGEKDGETKKAEAEGDAAAQPAATDLSALLATAATAPAAPPPTVPVLPVDLPAALAAAPAAAPAPVVAELSAETDAITATSAKAAVATSGIAVALTAGKAVALQAATPASGEAEVDTPAAGDADKTLAAGTEKPLLHTAKEAALDPAAPAANQNATPAEFRLTDAPQPAQGQIDLLALAQTRLARPDALPGLAALDQAIAAQTTTRGQVAADGQPTPLHVVPIEIGLRALAGSRQFDIRLDPAELGRIDVSLDISDKGEVKARLVVDRVETLHLLQRDARTLERAFEQAGLKPSDAGVDITLRDPADQSGFRQNRQQDDAPRRARAAAETGDDIAIPAQPAPIRRLVRLGGVDLSI